MIKSRQEGIDAPGKVSGTSHDGWWFSTCKAIAFFAASRNYHRKKISPQRGYFAGSDAGDFALVLSIGFDAVEFSSSRSSDTEGADCILRVCEQRVCLEPLIFPDLILCMRFHFFILSDDSDKYVSLSYTDSDDDEIVSVSTVLRFLEVVYCRKVGDLLAEPEGKLLYIVE